MKSGSENRRKLPETDSEIGISEDEAAIGQNRLWSKRGKGNEEIAGTDGEGETLFKRK